MSCDGSFLQVESCTVKTAIPAAASKQNINADLNMSVRDVDNVRCHDSDGDLESLDQYTKKNESVCGMLRIRLLV
jgi:hypothetical protein